MKLARSSERLVAFALQKDSRIEYALRGAAIFWWTQGDAAQSAHCLKRLILVTEDAEQRRYANSRFPKSQLSPLNFFRDAYLMLGHVLAMSGRYNEALEAMSRAARSRPPLARPHVCRAGVLAHIGRFAEAIESYETAARLLKRVDNDARNAADDEAAEAAEESESERDEAEEARVALALEYCRCRQGELAALENERHALEAELETLNNYNEAMERALELRAGIERRSASESTSLAGFLAYTRLRHGATQSVRCLGSRTDDDRDRLVCYIIDTIEFLRSGLRAHEEYSEKMSVSDASAILQLPAKYARVNSDVCRLNEHILSVFAPTMRIANKQRARMQSQ